MFQCSLAKMHLLWFCWYIFLTNLSVTAYMTVARIYIITTELPKRFAFGCTSSWFVTSEFDPYHARLFPWHWGKSMVVPMPVKKHCSIYRQISNIRRAWAGNDIVVHSNVVIASPVGAAPTTSSFSTQHLASIYCTDTTPGRDEKHSSFGIWCALH